MRHKKGLSRRQFIGAATAAGTAAASRQRAGVNRPVRPGRQPPPAAGSRAQPDVTLVLVNGRIHTMDARNTIASTVSIRNGRFVAVGDTPPARAANTRVIDLKGRTVVPGLIEGHVHIVSLANRPGYHTILENTTSIREIQEALAARRKDVPEGQWITSMGGWHPNQWAEHRHPTRQELDAAVPDRPVLLYERFTGPCVTNSLGKAFFDAADAAAPVHPNIVPVKVADNGAIAAGRLHRRRAVGERAVPPAPAADLRGQEAQHARRDGLLGQRRADRAPGRSPVSDAGAAASRTRSCRTSISTGCTTRGSRCTAKARRSSGCR